jgi:hypothetical protein
MLLDLAKHLTRKIHGDKLPGGVAFGFSKLNGSVAFGFSPSAIPGFRSLARIADALRSRARAWAVVLISGKPEDPNDPDAPFAMVGAPLKPRPPLNRSSIAVQPEQ